MRGAVIAPLAIGILLASGCSSPETPSARTTDAGSPSISPSSTKKKGPDNKKLVARTWKRYADAVVFRDEEDAIELVQHGTINYFDQVRFAASNAGPEQIGRMPLADRLLIGALRLRYKPDRLLRMDAEDVMGFCLEEGLGGIRLKTSRLKLVHVKVDAEDGFAIGRFKMKGGEEGRSVRIDFIREGGDWKIDFLPIIRATSTFLVALARDEGIDVDTLILRILELQAGRPVDESIWELPKD